MRIEKPWWFRYRKKKSGKFQHEEDGYVRWKTEKDEFLDIEGNVVKDPQKTPEWGRMTPEQRKAAKDEFQKRTHISSKYLNE